jgi:tetratricopeptide (TPR) repeat protein
MSQALGEAEEALQLDPYDRQGYEALAFALHGLGDLDRALGAAQEAVRLGPKSDTAHYILGLCYRDTGDGASAVKAFETFLTLYMDRAYVRDRKVVAEAYLAGQE